MLSLESRFSESSVDGCSVIWMPPWADRTTDSRSTGRTPADEMVPKDIPMLLRKGFSSRDAELISKIGALPAMGALTCP
jgi:hypothetical protein